MSSTISLSFIILTFNEEKHISRCIKSILPVSHNIFIIDSFSTDETVNIATSLGAKVLQNKWINYSNQFNWGIKNSEINTDWIMRLDADEYLSYELQNELKSKLNSIQKDITGLILNYKHYFLGRWIKHGTRYPLPLLRIWRNGVGYIEKKWMDERVILTYGDTMLLQSDFIHDDLNDITYFISKHNGYSTREAIDHINKEYSIFILDEKITSLEKKQHLNLWLKNKFYSKSFLFFRSFVYFFYRYFIKLGFLDGKPGLIYHILQGFWYRFLVDAKVYELKKKYTKKSDLIDFIKNKYGID